ncbi:hypothetical protein QIH77_02185 [Bradyrhizobium diazoefficiens]|uniref:hypothetical protein n=1 Tax=Bradyrhizobium diazoefficiens TaxID=1355477 RepID=UPI00272B8DAB|nr:hypothetical protein [Bradyrhizobium diazoefficiens]WLA74068.1 hypothetical protein QIH77_02185 [Bradyrhizobium diazoefficiens]
MDIQKLAGGSILAFRGETVPVWAINYGEDGPRVVLEVEANDGGTVGSAGFVLLPGVIRATRVTRVRFMDEEQQHNFFASYSLFPEVPVSLIPHTIGGISIDGSVDKVPEIGGDPIDSTARNSLEYYAGWAAGLFEQLRAGKHETAIREHLRQPGNSPATLASSFLQLLNPSASALDVAVWGATIEALSKQAPAHGFDRSEVLQEVAVRLRDQGAADPESAETWISTCKKVIAAAIDPPPLDDDEHIGQRAALAALLSPDARSAASLTETLGAGPIVQTLAMVAARAFDGLSRLDSRQKDTIACLDAILAVAEAIASGAGVDALIAHQRITETERARDISLTDGKERSVTGPESRSYEPLLYALASEVGVELQIDPDRRKVYFVPSTGKSLRIFLEEDPASTQDAPVVRFLIPLGIIGGRSGNKLQAYLLAAWKTGCAVGLRDTEEGRLACAFASQSAARLDRHEFLLHVSRLSAFAAETTTKKRRRSVSAKQNGA